MLKRTIKGLGLRQQKLSTILALIALLVPNIAVSDTTSSGMIKTQSHHSVSDTADRLIAVLEKKGMTVFNRINHGEGAKKAGVDINQIELVIFGNPKVGSPLMKCAPSVAIDLPQKALIQQDAKGKVWLSYNDPMYLKKRHNIQGCDQILNKVKNALNNFATAATSK